MQQSDLLVRQDTLQVAQLGIDQHRTMMVRPSID